MSDKYLFQDTVISSSRNMFLVNRSDTAPIVPLPKALRFNAAGTVVLRTVDAQADVTIAVTAGEVLVARVQFVRNTGTTLPANSIHALA